MDTLTTAAHAEPPLAAAPPHETGEAHPHVVPLRVLVTVWLCLLALTGLTVLASLWDFGGSVNLWVAIMIATAKASLVLLFFMHLKYDSPFYAIIFVTALVFLTLFICLALLDTEHYESTLIPNYAPLINNP